MRRRLAIGIQTLRKLSEVGSYNSDIPGFAVQVAG